MNNKSVLGYSKGSPYRNNPFLDINTPQGLIDMSNTDIPLYAQDETGYGKFLPPYSGMHQFNGSTVREVPVKQMGGLAAGQYIGQKRYMQAGGMQDAYDFLFGDDEDTPKKTEEKQTVTAPSTGEMGIDQRQHQQQLLEDEQNQLAFSQANYKPTDYFAMFGMQNPNSFEGDAEIMGGPIGANGPAPSGPVNPNAPAQSSGKYGADHIGQYGHQIINQLSTDLGYSPTLNSIYRDPAQQAALVKQGVGAPNSWHLTGDAVDLKPEDWNHLTKDEQSQFRSNYDVIYHNNHYHIEPKGKRMGRGGRFTPKY